MTFKKTKLHFTYLFIILIIGYLISGCGNNPQFDSSQSTFAGSQTCLECHQKEFRLWKNSDHDNAMDTAIASTVLGDFNNAEFERNGFTSRFFTENGKYFVHTKGPGGEAGDFQIAYTFGVRPLQQYLIPFENGRLQCLQLTWDTERNQWYHLGDSVYNGQEILPDDWLYWTNNAQNWNAMCAECHSTNLQKNYNPKTHVYNTTWSEIDVACEACHGPGSEHNRWATIDSLKRPKITNYALVVQTNNITSSQLVNQCAYCHSRRSSFDDFIHPRKNLFDVMSPQLPIEPYYHADGQILEEDYVYASFTQSKMHQQKVRCTNCHDAHSLELKFNGNNLCYQCHKPEDYEKYEHHFHKNFNEEGEPLVLQNGEKIIEVGEGSQCITCHMPAQYFMGIDLRNDHSMRIPRPDLSDKLGTPNACIQCHTNKTNQWAADFTEKWYGKPTRFHFGETMFQATNNDTAAIPMLIDLLNDEKTSALIKASATHYLGNFPTRKTISFNKKMLNSNEALVRRESIRNFQANNIDDLKKTLLPLLDDPSRMIRMESAFKLSVINPSDLDIINAKKLNKAIDEYIDAMEYSADFAGSRHNLGNLYTNLGKSEKAIENYKEAIKIDNQFYPAKINLATLFNRLGKNEKAENLLLDVTNKNPELGDAFYSLGLLQAEIGKYDQSISNLKKATELLPEYSRAWFNYFNMLDFKNHLPEAEKTLNKCLEIDPQNTEFLYAKIEFLLKQKRENEAVEIATTILEFYPNSPDKKELQNFIYSHNQQPK
jgi:predicted CXXCH cytochrome family protein